MSEQLTHIDLFSGIGGFTLAGEWAGFRTVVFCEKERFCQKVLQKRFGAVIADSTGKRLYNEKNKQKLEEKRGNKFYLSKSRNIPLIPEIRDFDGTKWRGATLLTGGFPCQPFSDAGKKRGKEDDRYLWPEMLRVIGEAKPHWILAENVPGIFRMALDTVLADLEGEGYTTGTFIIPACGLDAPHRRNRVWIIAHTRKQERNWLSSIGGQEMAKIGRKNQDAQDTIETGTRNQNREIDDQGGRISQNRRESIQQKDGKVSTGRITSTDKYASDSSNLKGWSKQKIKPGGEARIEVRKHRRVSQRIWNKNWLEVAARFCRVDDGVSDRVHRLKALGNAIVPQVAYEILKNIAWIENEKTYRS